MDSISRRTLLTTLTAGLAATATSVRPAAAAIVGGTAGAAIIPPSTNRRNFPNVPLLTHENRRVRFYDDMIKGKIVLINFFYTHCTGICIPATANLRKVQKLLGDRVGKDIFFVSISLKPLEDRPSDLKDYYDAHDVQPGWTFLTGTAANCELLRRRLGFADVDPERDRDITQHSGLVVFGNEPYDRWTACPALANSTEIVKAVSWVDWPA